MTYIIVIHEPIIKYILTKLNTNLQRNVFGIMYHFYLIIIPVELKKNSNIQSLQGFAKYVKRYFFNKISKIHAKDNIAIYVCNIKKDNHPSPL